MISVHYFARFREQLGTESESLDFSDKTATVRSLTQMLAQRGESWADIFEQQSRLMIAINQEMASPDSVIQDGDEVAFFPPVTGG